MKSHHRLDHSAFRIPPGESVSLADHDPAYSAGFRDKAKAEEALADDVSALAEAQETLYASGENSVLIIFQAMDAAGKDGAIKYVMSGVNPQGCEVTSFKAPTNEELLHHYLWRPARALPPRGRIGIFNRSYYEEVLVVRVHPELLERQHLPRRHREVDLGTIWRDRYEEINAFERMLTDNETCLIKFFLHVSREEQRERFLKRLTEPDKHWKFSAADVRERGHWPAYMQAYEEMLAATSTERAPWYVIPADDKRFMRVATAEIVAGTLDAMDLSYPELSEEERAEVARIRSALASPVEDDAVT